jgi:hypothetical protein
LIYTTNLTISVISIDGKVVRKINDTYPASKSTVTFKDLTQGVYIVKVEQDASFNSFKLIVN